MDVVRVSQMVDDYIDVSFELSFNKKRDCAFAIQILAIAVGTETAKMFRNTDVQSVKNALDKRTELYRGIEWLTKRMSE